LKWRRGNRTKRFPTKEARSRNRTIGPDQVKTGRGHAEKHVVHRKREQKQKIPAYLVEPLFLSKHLQRFIFMLCCTCDNQFIPICCGAASYAYKRRLRIRRRRTDVAKCSTRWYHAHTIDTVVVHTLILGVEIITKMGSTTSAADFALCTKTQI